MQTALYKRNVVQKGVRSDNSGYFSNQQTIYLVRNQHIDTGELGYDGPLYDRFLHMTDNMLGPSPMHIKYSSYVYDIESVISKFTSTINTNCGDGNQRKCVTRCSYWHDVNDYCYNLCALICETQTPQGNPSRD